MTTSENGTPAPEGTEAQTDTGTQGDTPAGGEGEGKAGEGDDAED